MNNPPQVSRPRPLSIPSIPFILSSSPQSASIRVHRRFHHPSPQPPNFQLSTLNSQFSILNSPSVFICVHLWFGSLCVSASPRFKSPPIGPLVVFSNEWENRAPQQHSIRRHPEQHRTAKTRKYQTNPSDPKTDVRCCRGMTYKGYQTLTSSGPPPLPLAPSSPLHLPFPRRVPPHLAATTREPPRRNAGSISGRITVQMGPVAAARSQNDLRVAHRSIRPT